MAELNGIDEQTAWSRFETARNALLSCLNDDQSSSPNLDEESLLIFLVWTQSQRLSKQQEFTWDYFSGLLNPLPGCPEKTVRGAVMSWLNRLPLARGGYL